MWLAGQIIYWAQAHMISHLRNWIFVTGAKLGLRLYLSWKYENGGWEFFWRGQEEHPFVMIVRWGNKRHAQAQQMWMLRKRTRRRPLLPCSHVERTRGARNHDKWKFFLSSLSLSPPFPPPPLLQFFHTDVQWFHTWAIRSLQLDKRFVFISVCLSGKIELCSYLTPRLG